MMFGENHADFQDSDSSSPESALSTKISNCFVLSITNGSRISSTTDLQFSSRLFLDQLGPAGKYLCKSPVIRKRLLPFRLLLVLGCNTHEDCPLWRANDKGRWKQFRATFLFAQAVFVIARTSKTWR
jgi:hypothetical protein